MKKVQQNTPSCRIQFPIFQSIGQAAAAIGAPQALVKAAKRQGCKAFFAGGRVDSGILLPFLFQMITKKSDLPPGMVSAYEWLTIEKAKREQIRRKKDEKQMMPIAEAVAQATIACHFIFGRFDQWRNELPPSFAGCTAIECWKILNAAIERLRTDAKAEFEKVGT